MIGTGFVFYGMITTPRLLKLSIIINIWRLIMKKSKIGFITPGEILLEEFLSPLGISPNKLAIEIKVPATRIYAIVKGVRAISADTDLRLSKYFGTSQGFWLGLQADHDLDVVKQNIASDLITIRKYENIEKLLLVHYNSE